MDWSLLGGIFGSVVFPILSGGLAAYLNIIKRLDKNDAQNELHRQELANVKDETHETKNNVTLIVGRVKQLEETVKAALDERIVKVEAAIKELVLAIAEIRAGKSSP